MPQQMMAPAFQPPNTSSNNIFGSPHGSQVATHAAGKGGGLGLAASVDIIAVWLPRLPPCCSRWQRMMTGRQHRGEGGSQMAMISNPAAKPKSDLRQHRGSPVLIPAWKDTQQTSCAVTCGNNKERGGEPNGYDINTGGKSRNWQRLPRREGEEPNGYDIKTGGKPKPPSHLLLTLGSMQGTQIFGLATGVEIIAIWLPPLPLCCHRRWRHFWTCCWIWWSCYHSIYSFGSVLIGLGTGSKNLLVYKVLRLRRVNVCSWSR